MDKFLQSLLTSSAGASMEATEGTLSHIARSVLVEGAGQDPRSLREKAGLLALLNLLGIVETFYWSSGEDVTPKTGPPALSFEKSPAPTSTIAPQSAPSGPLGGLDPSLLTGILSLVGSMAKARPGSRQPARVESGAGGGESGGESEGDPGYPPGTIATGADATGAGVAGGGTGGEDVSADAAGQAATGDREATVHPAPPPPSPIQQILGIDPKVLTLILNVLADFMKTRAPEQKDKTPQTRAIGEETPQQIPSPSLPPVSARSGLTAPPRRTPGGAGLYHRPGLGIYRTVPRPVRRDGEGDMAGSKRLL